MFSQAPVCNAIVKINTCFDCHIIGCCYNRAHLELLLKLKIT